MFVEIAPSSFGTVCALFAGKKQYLPVSAVVEKNFPGRIFVNHARNPECAVVWAIGRWAHIETADHTFDITVSLPHLLRKVILPDARELGMSRFELYTRNSADWLVQLDNALLPFNAERHMESVSLWDRAAYERFRTGYEFPAEISIERTQTPILPREILDSRFVPHGFRDRTGICCEAKFQDRVVAFCRSHGFEVGKEFMIDVETEDVEDRAKGYATAASVGLLDYCLQNGFTPLWEATEQNIPSQRLAKKLGFVEQERYPVYAIRI